MAQFMRSNSSSMPSYTTSLLGGGGNGHKKDRGGSGGSGGSGGIPTPLALLLVLVGGAGAFWLGLHAHGSVYKQPALATPGQTAAGLPVRFLSQAAAHAPVGRHITLDFYQVPKALSVALEDTAALHRRVSRLIKQAGMTLLGHSCHVFEVQGVTCAWLLSESHLSLHTWPEHGYAALDIFTCGTKARPELLAEGMKAMMQPGLVVREEQKRGGLELSELTPAQRKAKELHTFLASTNEDDADGLEFVFHRVPILRTFRSPYQHIQVVEAHGQLGRCLLLDNKVQFCSHDLDGYTNHMSLEPLKALTHLRAEPCAAKAAAGKPAAATNSRGAKALAAAAGRVSTSSGTTHSAAATSLVPHPPFHPAASHTKDNFIACHAPELSAQLASSCGKDSHTPARVLLIGGGDGWIAGHLVGCYGRFVHSVRAVELDKAVSDVTSAFFFNVTGLDPFNHPRITWDYTDAFGWVKKEAVRCAGTQDDAADDTDAAAAAAGLATAHRRQALAAAAAPAGCQPYDLVIIDSTDHDEGTSGTLYTQAFYAALHALMAPRASLVQQFNTYDREYEAPLAASEAAMRGGGWDDVFKSLVYTPAYSGETVFLQAVKREA